MSAKAHPKSHPKTNGAPDIIEELLADENWRMKVEARFWTKVMKPLDWTACWEWTGAKRRDPINAYGKIKVRSYCDVRAHRLSYALYYSRSPGNLLVCHHCDNPSCVNPSHLFLGTNADNSADKVAKGCAKTSDQTGEKNGRAKLSASDVDEIRALIMSGHTNTAIAAKFMVSHHMISRIRRGRSWGGEVMQEKYASIRRPRQIAAE